MDVDVTKDWVWDFDENNGVISSVNTTDGFLEYWSMMNELKQTTRRNYRLLCVEIFLDGFQQQKSRRKNQIGIYMRITNQVLSLIILSLIDDESCNYKSTYCA